MNNLYISIAFLVDKKTNSVYSIVNLNVGSMEEAVGSITMQSREEFHLYNLMRADAIKVPANYFLEIFEQLEFSDAEKNFIIKTLEEKQ